MNKKRKLCIPHYTAKLLERRDAAEIGIRDAKTIHEQYKHQRKYDHIINKLRRLEA